MNSVDIVGWAYNGTLYCVDHKPVVDATGVVNGSGEGKGVNEDKVTRLAMERLDEYINRQMYRSCPACGSTLALYQPALQRHAETCEYLRAEVSREGLAKGGEL